MCYILCYLLVGGSCLFWVLYLLVICLCIGLWVVFFFLVFCFDSVNCWGCWWKLWVDWSGFFVLCLVVYSGYVCLVLKVLLLVLEWLVLLVWFFILIMGVFFVFVLIGCLLWSGSFCCYSDMWWFRLVVGYVWRFCLSGWCGFGWFVVCCCWLCGVCLWWLFWLFFVGWCYGWKLVGWYSFWLESLWGNWGDRVLDVIDFMVLVCWWCGGVGCWRLVLVYCWNVVVFGFVLGFSGCGVFVWLCVDVGCWFFVWFRLFCNINCCVCWYIVIVLLCWKFRMVNRCFVVVCCVGYRLLVLRVWIIVFWVSFLVLILFDFVWWWRVGCFVVWLGVLFWYWLLLLWCRMGRLRCGCLRLFWFWCCNWGRIVCGGFLLGCCCG